MAEQATTGVAEIGDTTLHTRKVTASTMAVIVVAVAALYFARDVLLPLAIAMLITFALSPLVTFLRKRGLPHMVTVLAVVAAAFTAIALFLFVVVAQLGTLAQNLPTFQSNIIAKVESLREAGGERGVLSRVSDMIGAINSEIGQAVPAQADPAEATASSVPMPVEVVERKSAVQMLEDLVLPLISPFATTGLVIVVVIFMLLEREELRDRFIRLVGSNDLHRTTQVLEDAGQRVANYLVIQLLVNVIYAVPIGLGLWLIGVPNATLWGLLTLVLRFVPYIGSVLAAAFPLFLAFAVSPDWSAVIYTVALFAVVELTTSNVIEPWLYGSRTGVSPLAIIVAAIFWTWIWGPLGLVLSTPLTVCLVVLGRHIPQFEVFDILFGDEPVLAPHARLYQRLLAGDAIETTFRAEEALETAYLVEYYRDVGIPALLIAQNDYGRGVLTADQEDRLARVGLQMVADLQEVVAEELGEEPEDSGAEAAAEGPIGDQRLEGAGYRVICIGGRSKLDDVSAAMLAQAMEAEGAETVSLPHTDLAPTRFRALDTQGKDCLVLSFLDPSPSRASLLHIRRIKRAVPHLRVGVVIWQMPAGVEDGTDAARRMAPVPEAKLQEALDIGADFAVTGIEAAYGAAFVDEAPKPVPVVAKRQARAAGRRKVAAA